MWAQFDSKTASTEGVQMSAQNYTTLKVAICDDNPQERQFFLNMCKVIKNRLQVQIRLKEYTSGNALLFDMENSRIMATVDIVLLDIHLADNHGIEIARKLREMGYQGAIIFVTRSGDHWRDAFDVEAFNYITKDKDIENRFATTFVNALRKAKSRRSEALIFSAIGETRRIPIADILYFEVNDKLMRVHYNNDKFEFVSTLTKIENLLFGNEDFVRVNRNNLISVSHIDRLEGKDAIMLNGDSIAISPKHMKKLKTAMGKS